MTRQPALFVSHSNPMLLLNPGDHEVYQSMAADLPTAKAILVFSAHWETQTLAFGETRDHTELVYDYYGFPDALYEVQYPAPGAPWLADRIEQNLGVTLPRLQRGLDHGVFVPFLQMWPDADIPVLQMTMPANLSNEDLFQLGQQLRPLRDEGILIIGAGTLTHNLRAFRPDVLDTPDWAQAFDDWVVATLDAGDRDALLQWQERAPQAKQNHPTPEHFRPLLIAAGAGDGDVVSYPMTGFEFGSFSMRSVRFG